MVDYEELTTVAVIFVSTNSESGLDSESGADSLVVLVFAHTHTNKNKQTEKKKKERGGVGGQLVLSLALP